MAVRGPDPHNLRRLANQSAPIIDVDRECSGCGYNLRGLRMGVNCPECGMPSIPPAGVDDPLSLMPMRVILAVVWGCWVAAICVALMVAAVFADRFGFLKHGIAMVILTGLSMIWCGAVCWLTPAFSLPQAVSRGFSLRSRLRRAARWLQVGWVIGTGAAAAVAMNSSLSAPMQDLLWVVQIAGLMTGLAGLVLLSVLLERLSEWVRDEDAQKMFNWAMWSWPLAMLVYMPVQAVLSAWLGSGGSYKYGGGMFVLLWMLAIGTFPYGLMMLAKSVTLSILHNVEHRERSERRLQRQNQFTEEASNRALRTKAQPRKQ